MTSKSRLLDLTAQLGVTFFQGLDQSFSDRFENRGELFERILLGIFRMPPKHFRFESDVPMEQPSSTLRFVPRRSAPDSFGLASEYLFQRI